MTQFIFPQLEREKLEQAQKIFYGRLNPKESFLVRIFTEHISMAFLSGRSLLIAGVGSILRFDDPSHAKDIDIAVSGFKYTLAPGRLNRHTFSDVCLFTRMISAYFEDIRKYIDSWGIDSRLLARTKTKGPFTGFDQTWELNDSSRRKIGEMSSDLEEFGRYYSKGFQIRFEGIKPIDIHFVFNRTTHGWKYEQGSLKEQPQKSKWEISPKFYFAPLYERSR